MLATRPGLSSVMVGRAPELASLLSGVSETRAGARVVLISGEAGIGKTRLLVELAEGVGAHTKFLGAQAEPTAMGRPFQLLQDALGPEVEGWKAVPVPLLPIEDAVRVLLGPAARGLSGGSEREDEGRAHRSDELLAAGSSCCASSSPGAGESWSSRTSIGPTLTAWPCSAGSPPPTSTS